MKRFIFVILISGIISGTIAHGEDNIDEARSKLAIEKMKNSRIEKSVPAISPAQAEAQALGAKLMSEINAGLKCGADLISLQRELAVANARIKELENPEQK